MQKITTFLWFDNQAEEAANFYTSIFKNSKIKKISRYSDAGPGPKGSVMVLTFELEGQQFTALNGGPVFNRPDQDVLAKGDVGGEKRDDLTRRQGASARARAA